MNFHPCTTKAKCRDDLNLLNITYYDPSPQMPSEWPRECHPLPGDWPSLCSHWATAQHGAAAFPGVCGLPLLSHCGLCPSTAPAQQSSVLHGGSVHHLLHGVQDHQHCTLPVEHAPGSDHHLTSHHDTSVIFSLSDFLSDMKWLLECDSHILGYEITTMQCVGCLYLVQLHLFPTLIFISVDMIPFHFISSLTSLSLVCQLYQGVDF